MGKRHQEKSGNLHKRSPSAKHIRIVPEYRAKLRSRSNICSISKQNRKNALAPRLSRLDSLGSPHQDIHPNKIVEVLTVENVIKNTKSKQVTLSLKMKKILMKIPIVSLPRIGEEQENENMTIVAALSSTINETADMTMSGYASLQDVKPNQEILDRSLEMFGNTDLDPSLSMPLVSLDPESNKTTLGMSVEWYNDTSETTDSISTLPIIEYENGNEFVVTQASDTPTDSESEPTVMELEDVYILVWNQGTIYVTVHPVAVKVLQFS